MGFRGFQLGALLAGAAISAGAATRYPVDFPLKLQNHATKKPLQLPAKRGYTYEVREELTDVAVLKIFNSYGKPLDGSYEITVEDLRQLGREIDAGLKAANGAPARPKCESCQTSEGLDRRPALDRPPERRAPTTKAELCGRYDQFREQGVPRAPLRQALLFYLGRLDDFGPRRATKPVVAIADYSQSSREPRFYVLDLLSGAVTREKVSHAAGRAIAGFPGDPRRARGMLERCGTSGADGLQRPGFYRFGDYLFSARGRSWPRLTGGANGVQLIGLTPKVNWGADDAGVAHELTLNANGRGPMARTSGSLAFVPGRGREILAKLHGGALLYAYAPQCPEEMAPALAQVKGWESLCGDEEEADPGAPRSPVAENVPNHRR